MFSIARYIGDDEENKDTRTLEKKQERLDKLNARIANKKRKDDSNSVQDQKEPAEKKRKNSTAAEADSNTKSLKENKKLNVQKSEKKTKKESKVEDMEIDTVQENVEIKQIEEEEVIKKEEEEVEEEEEEKVALVEEADIPTLEAFPDLLGPKAKRSKEDVKILRNMGIPEWMLQPTVVSPKDSCDLDKAGLSEHIIQRCKDLGLSSLFAGKYLRMD